MKTIYRILLYFFIGTSWVSLNADDGYRLWLRYDIIDDSVVLSAYRGSISGWMAEGVSPVMKAVSNEMHSGLNGLLGMEIPKVSGVPGDGTIVAGTPQSSKIIASLRIDELKDLGDEGFIILASGYRGKKIMVIAANTDIGVLYGTFRFLRILQTQGSLQDLPVRESPSVKLRLLNHWDNLDGTVERGYAGRSLWEWDSLPGVISSRYTDYARANASVGINGTVLTNVNANARVLTREYLVKVAALADIFRPYGIKVYLTARFSAPLEIGNLPEADPLDPEVCKWWKEKVQEIYGLIPDFGGFLVKANSEGQPGPQNYGRSHSDGANILADALAPYHGVVMWRAFVYSSEIPEDRTKQAYNEFIPLDGKFRNNVIIQVKNGPLDFQPREPFHPLFGGMLKTPVMAEFQVTQEYLGFSTHLVFLAPLWEECLKSDTWAQGEGSLVAEVVGGRVFNSNVSAIAGVANTGSVRNWTGHPFAQANWYAFGRLAWNPCLSSAEIAGEWIRMTFTNEESAIQVIEKIMLESREAAVNYMTPLGLHHIMSEGLHYGPGPWVSSGRRDWTSVYYHRADSSGIGFERSSAGSDAVSQYYPEVRDRYNNLITCPENLLLWFHHVPWTYRLSSGRDVWEELCYRYNSGVYTVRSMRRDWEGLNNVVDTERFVKVSSLLQKQEENAVTWRDACLLYFQTFSKRPVPGIYEQPAHTLEYYKTLTYSF